MQNQEEELYLKGAESVYTKHNQYVLAVSKPYLAEKESAACFYTHCGSCPLIIIFVFLDMCIN